MSATKRKSVERKVVGKKRLGEVCLLKITYIDGGIQFGASYGGILSLFHSERAAKKVCDIWLNGKYY